MELRRYFALLTRWWWLLLVGLFLGGASAFLVTRAQPPVYRATATLFVNQTAAPGSLTYSDALLNQQLVKTYSQMARQPVVLETVRQRLQLPFDLRTLDAMVAIQPIRDTQLIEVAVEGNDPAQVRDIANAVADVFIEQQTPYLPPGQGASALRVAQPAVLPLEPVGPRVLLNTALAALIGLLVMVGVVALLEYLDDTVKTPEDLERAAALVSLGGVLRLGDRKNNPAHLIFAARHWDPAAEAYRLVRTNLEFAAIDQPLATLLVTSAGPGEGKSTTVANLALVMAQAGKRVIVVDADLRKPNLHRLFEVPNKQGLTNLLLAETPALDGYLQAGVVEGLSILPSGPLPPNPAELLASPRLASLLERLKAGADMVLLDSPPALAVADALVLAGRVDGTLLVVDAQGTRADAVRRASEALVKSGTWLVGAVLNKLGKGSGAYYYYYHEYGRDGASGNGKGAGTGDVVISAEG